VKMSKTSKKQSEAIKLALLGAFVWHGAALCACSPDEGIPDHEDVTVTGADDTGSEAGTGSESDDGTPWDLPEEDNWGIKLDVGPPYSSGTDGDES